MAKFNHLGEAQSIRGLAQYTEEVRDRFINLAISYNINIITGSMPYVKEDGGLYNVGFLVRRDGSYEMYEKVHVTPDEIKSWGLSGGKMVQTFDTDCAKIGILIVMMWNFPSSLVSWPIRECRFCLFHSSPILRTAIPVYVFVLRHGQSRMNVLSL